MLESRPIKTNPIFICDITFEYEVKKKRHIKTVEGCLNTTDIEKVTDWSKKFLTKHYCVSKVAKFVRIIKIENARRYG